MNNTIRDKALELLSRQHGAPDLDALAITLARSLSSKDMREMVIHQAREILREEIRNARRQDVSSGRSKWTVAASVFVGARWKLEDECTFEDLNALADDYADRIVQFRERERYYRDLADQLAASGCATVGEMRAREESLAA